LGVFLAIDESGAKTSGQVIREIRDFETVLGASDRPRDIRVFRYSHDWIEY
jgi:hypothetical protein